MNEINLSMNEKNEINLSSICTETIMKIHLQCATAELKFWEAK